MAYVLTLLFTSPFIDRKESRWFVIMYAFILLVAKDIRLYFDYAGADFFLFHSYVQMVCMITSVLLLDKGTRVAAASVFLMFSLYNISITWWWGMIPIDYYDWISLGIIVAQLGIITWKEKNPLKNLCIFGVAYLLGEMSTRYI